MIEKLGFTGNGWEEYVAWQAQDKRVFKKINSLIKDIMRNGHSGVGHPEPLKANYSGYWSRKIDEKNRLVYRIVDDKEIEIIHCMGHYGDK